MKKIMNRIISLVLYGVSIFIILSVIALASSDGFVLIPSSLMLLSGFIIFPPAYRFLKRKLGDEYIKPHYIAALSFLLFIFSLQTLIDGKYTQEYYLEN